VRVLRVTGGPTIIKKKNLYNLYILNHFVKYIV
jgi:hypothetical protein